MKLVIVESPTKAKTIRNYLPKEYIVTACMGHIRDLPESASEIPAAVKDQAWARLGVNIERDFEPLYIVSAKKRKVVAELKNALKDVDELILATDEDREGESIGWHLVEVLKPKIAVKRIVFHEITRDAIQEAIRHPRSVDAKLVRAQETRRILDRLVGYTVSPLLWKKIAPGLSAGRVQSVAVRLLCLRELERHAFRSGSYWDVRATITASSDPKLPFEAFLQALGGQRIASGKDFDPATGKVAAGKKVLLLDEKSAGALVSRLRKAVWRVGEVTEKETLRKPAPPFTTSTLQQEANRKLRLSSRQTMQIAQGLYENGHITYMRTDSTNLSNEAITAARKVIALRYGADYLSPQPRRYTTKAKNAQEAHEAIRPAGTAMLTAEELGLSGTEGRLYDLIWKRTIACQMADARLTQITAAITAEDALFQATGRRIDFAGFFRAYVEGSDDPDAALEDKEMRLPALSSGDTLTLRDLVPLGHETQPPNRFTEASLVQTLEKEGIGRPSTYATIMGTIQDRDYVVKQANQLVPTFRALAVNGLLETHFPDLVDTGFTARMEQALDDIAEGDAEWLPYLKGFFRGTPKTPGLEDQVNEKTRTIDPREVVALRFDRINAQVRIGRYGAYLEQQNGDEVLRVSLPEDMPPSELNEETVLALLQKKEEGPNQVGRHPETGEPIYLLEGRFGPYVQLGEGKEGEKPRRASLLKGMIPKEITLRTAVALLSLPRLLGNHPADGAEVSAGVGRYGPFIKHGSEFRSLAVTDDVLTIDLKRALELLSQPKSGGRRFAPALVRELGVHPKDGGKVSLMDGRYGLYVKYGEVNATIPKGTNPEAVTLDMALAWIAAKPAATKTEARRKPAATGKKPSTAKGGTGAAKKPAPRKPATKPTSRKK
ncbi:MAG TPA: type I DNA topoisomerase [Aggregatilineales bacterium]|nr:type I DNA topoisomerase [Anaerolineales bacterium]HRE47704.1 type I DNA topoisomerase [Aggregatilineales bacterium]